MKLGVATEKQTRKINTPRRKEAHNKKKKVCKAKKYNKKKEENGRGKRKQGVTIALVCTLHFTILG